MLNNASLMVRGAEKRADHHNPLYSTLCISPLFSFHIASCHALDE